MTNEVEWFKMFPNEMRAIAKHYNEIRKTDPNFEKCYAKQKSIEAFLKEFEKSGLEAI